MKPVIFVPWDWKMKNSNALTLKELSGISEEVQYEFAGWEQLGLHHGDNLPEVVGEVDAPHLPASYPQNVPKVRAYDQK